MDLLHDTETIEDLSALAWVHDELRRSLEAAHKAMRRYLKEAAAVADSDTDAVDPSVLRGARAQIHQGVGALELVGLPTAAQVLRASEAALQKLTGRPVKLDAASVDTLEQASFALLDYLARLLAGKPVSPLALFPEPTACIRPTCGPSTGSGATCRATAVRRARPTQPCAVRSRPRP
jgi:chemosensory pili system protein ChpA (sensor histidine kinase/response regulator)